MAEELYIWIPRWDEFQTYQTKRGKQWTPPWIRNYTRLLDDHNYLSLTVRQRGILHGIWLLVARTRLELGSSAAHVGRMLGDPTVRTRDLKALEQAGFIQFCSRTVLERFQNCSNLEVEVEVELGAVRSELRREAANDNSPRNSPGLSKHKEQTRALT